MPRVRSRGDCPLAANDPWGSCDSAVALRLMRCRMGRHEKRTSPAATVKASQSSRRRRRHSFARHQRRSASYAKTAAMMTAIQTYAFTRARSPNWARVDRGRTSPSDDRFGHDDAAAFSPDEKHVVHAEQRHRRPQPAWRLRRAGLGTRAAREGVAAERPFLCTVGIRLVPELAVRRRTEGISSHGCYRVTAVRGAVRGKFASQPKTDRSARSRRRWRSFRE